MEVKIRIPAKDVDLAKKKAMEAFMRWAAAPKGGAPTVISGNGYHLILESNKDGSLDISVDFNPANLAK